MARSRTMKNDCLTSTMSSPELDVRAQWDRVVRRRSFLKGLGVGGAAGTARTGRLTTLLTLEVDRSGYTRSRSDQNPALGGRFAQAVTIHGGPATPLDDRDTPPDTAQPVPPVTDAARRMQAIANTAA